MIDCDCSPKVEDIYSNGLFGIPASRMPLRSLMVGIDHTRECIARRNAEILK